MSEILFCHSYKESRGGGWSKTILGLYRLVLPPLYVIHLRKVDKF